VSNPIKGETSFVADGKTFTLKYSSDAGVQLEDALDKGIIEIVAELQSWQKNPSKVRLGFIRSMFWAGLRDHHPEVDLKAAGDLMSAAGGLPGAFTLIGAAIAEAFPQAETKDTRPQNRAARRKAAAGTGKTS
jgi:hypothetical protein